MIDTNLLNIGKLIMGTISLDEIITTHRNDILKLNDLRYKTDLLKRKGRSKHRIMSGTYYMRDWDGT